MEALLGLLERRLLRETGDFDSRVELKEYFREAVEEWRALKVRVESHLKEPSESPLTADVRRRHADYIDQRSEGVDE